MLGNFDFILLRLMSMVMSLETGKLTLLLEAWHVRLVP